MHGDGTYRTGDYGTIVAFYRGILAIFIAGAEMIGVWRETNSLPEPR